MKHKIQLKKIIFRAVVSLLILCTVAYFYVSMMEKKLEYSMLTNLKEVAIQTSNNVRIKINGNLETIAAIASMLENEHSDDIEVWMDALQQTESKSKYKRIGIANLQGDVVTSDHQVFNISERSYFKEAIAGNRSVSTTLKDIVGNDNIQVYAVPIYYKQQIKAVLFGTVSTSIQADELLTPSFKNQGFSTIMDEQGNIILNSNSENSIKTVENMKEIRFDGNTQIESISSMDAHVMTFHDHEDKQWYFAYAPLGIKDWYVCSSVPRDIVSEQLNDFVQSALYAWLGVALIFTLILLYMYLLRQKHEEKMDDLVYQDPLMKHGNFNQFRVDTKDIFMNKERMKYALIDLDIKDFKMFNQLYGFQTGDQLLKIILQYSDIHCLQDEFCTRVNADHFLIMWKLQDRESLKRRMELLIHDINKQLEQHIHGAKLFFQVGVYELNEQDQDLGQCNNMALYAKRQMKHTGEQGIAFFSMEMYQRILEEKKLEKRMEEALEHREFEVYLQPKVTLKDYSIQEAEALVRWREPSRGLLMPDVFIGLFERNGFLEKLDRYLLEEVCKILHRWKQEHRKEIRISFNVSKSYIFKPGFAKQTYALVKEYNLNPNQLEIEITESIVFDNVAQLNEIIKELKEYGFSIAMDDFGSGYSSLNMLKEISIDVLKIDQAFFRGSSLTYDRAHVIVQGIIQLAKMLDIRIVAEGIELQDEVDFLSESSCDYAQGYYFAKPVPIEEFEKLGFESIV